MNTTIRKNIFIMKYIQTEHYKNVPVLKDDYFRMLREINPDGFDVFEKIR